LTTTLRERVVPRKELIGIASAVAIQSGAMNMVAVFVPLLLLKRGAGFSEVCLFFIAYTAVKFALDMPVAKWIIRSGARPVLMTGFVLSGLHMVLLHLFVINGSTWASYGSALALAGGNTCVWTSQHLHVSRVLDLARKGKDLALMDAMMRVANLLAPAVGGLLAVFGGDGLLLGVATGLTVLSVAPAWSVDKQVLNTPGGGAPRALAPAHVPWRDLGANLAFNAHNAVNLSLWPLYLAVAFRGFGEVGAITTFAGLVSFVVVMFAGGRTDKGGGRRVLAEGSVLCMLFHLARPLVGDPLTTTLVTAGSRTAASYQRIAWTGIYYTHAQRSGTGYVVRMEMGGDVGGLLIWLMLLAAWALSGREDLALSVTFLFAAIGALCVLVVRKEREVNGNAWTE
jgi:hypothetical protein